MTARSVTIQIPGHGCMDDLSSGCSLDVFGQFFGDNYRLGFSLSYTLS